MFIRRLHQLYRRLENGRMYCQTFCSILLRYREYSVAKRAEEREYHFGASELQHCFVCVFPEYYIPFMHSISVT